MMDNRKEKYARLIVRTGVNLQKGQKAIVTAAAEQAGFVRMVVRECYEAGASQVAVVWTDDLVTRMAYQYESREMLEEILPWIPVRAQWLVDELPARIFLDSEDPDSLSGCDPEKISASIAARQKILKPYRDQYDNRLPWTIAAIPSAGWARKVFPGLPEGEAVEALWERILACCRVTEDNDPAAAWDAHNRSFRRRVELLNECAFDRLHYENSLGTDLTVGLIPGVRWDGGGETVAHTGQYFNPNMPTEEIFTSPMRGRAEGTVFASKPLAYRGCLIRDFSLTFSEGKAVSCRAAEGEKILEGILSMDEGSSFLGEAALVPESSPVAQTGFLYYHTLFDENAGCHLALGAGFTNLLPGFEKMTPAECAGAGINDSAAHVDFMIGTPDMRITGIKKDGRSVEIFRDGDWTGDFREC